MAHAGHPAGPLGAGAGSVDAAAGRHPETAGTLPPVTVTAVDTLVWAAGAVVIAAVALLLALLAPWRSVRDESPLPPDVETRLLLGEDPDRVAADLGATTPSRDAPPGPPATGDPDHPGELSDLSDLAELAGLPEDGDPEDGDPDDGPDAAPSSSPGPSGSLSRSSWVKPRSSSRAPSSRA